MAITIRWYDRDASKYEYFTLPENVDVVTLNLPPRSDVDGQPDWSLPAVTVHVNTDAVMVFDTFLERRLGMLEYHELVAEAAS